MFSQYFIKVSENMQAHTYLYLLKVLVKAPAEGSGGGQESCHCGSTVLIQNALQKSEVQEDKYINILAQVLDQYSKDSHIKNVEVEQNYSGSGAIRQCAHFLRMQLHFTYFTCHTFSTDTRQVLTLIS